MNDVDILILESYVDDLATPKDLWPKYHFDELSYMRWAATEILERAIMETDLLPEPITGVYSKDVFDVIEEFAFDMQCGLESNDDWQYQKIYSIGIETANDMLKYYMSERRM